MSKIKIDIDSMLAKAGDFGRYQVFLMFLFSIVNIVSAFHYFSQTFISVVPEHWCNTSELHGVELNEFTVEKIREYLKPLKDVSCSRFRWDDPTVEGRWSFVNISEGDPMPAWTAEKCNEGWIYNRDNGFESIASEVS